MAKIIVRFLGDATHLNAVLGTAQARMGAFTAFMQRSMRLGAGAIVGFGALSVDAFADFDQAMTQSTAIMGDLSDEQMTALENAARQMAKTTTFSATEAAESIFFLSSAGLDAEQTIAALPAVAQFAQAGMFDMATATDLLTDAQSALGLSVDDATQNQENMVGLSDMLVRANTLANATVEQFSTALTTKAGPAMKAFGVETADGIAVLAALADQGIKAEVAGTNLSIVLRNLTTSAIKNKEAFREYGVEVFDAEGNLNDMASIVEDLELAFAGMSTEQMKNALLDLGFADKAQQSLLALLGSSDAIREYRSELEDAGGITEEVASKQLESFKSQINLLKSRFMDFAITVGSKLAPMILQAIDWLEAKWEEWGPTVREVMDDIGDAVSDVVGWVQDFVRNFRRDSGDAESTAGRLMAKFEEVKDAVQRVFARIQEVIQTVIEIVRVIWERWGDDIVTFLEDTVSALIQIWEGLWNVIQGVVEIIAGILTGDWGRIWEGAKQVVVGAIDVIVGTVRGIVARLKLIITIIKDVLVDLFDGPFNAAKDAVSGAIDSIVGFVKGLPDRLKELAGDILQAGVDIAGNLLQGIIDGIKNFTSFVGDFAAGLGRAMIDWFNTNVIDWINDMIPDKIAIDFAPDINLPDNPIPHIPSFAKGGVVTEPMVAMVGDAGPGNPEIITPEEKMRQVIREEGGVGSGIHIEKIEMVTTATPSDLSRELSWLMMTRGAAA